MVAAAKLRRAQEAADGGAALCRAHGRRCSANLAAAHGRPATGAARCSAAPAATTSICLSSAPPSAACAAPSTPSIARLAREHADRLMRARQDGQDSSASARRATTMLRRQLRPPDHRARRSARRAQLGFEQCRADRPSRIIALFEDGRVRRLHALLRAIQIGDRADADGAAAHPGAGRGGGRSAPTAAAPITKTSRTRRKSSPTSCRAISRCRSSGRCSRMPRPNRARG